MALLVDAKHLLNLRLGLQHEVLRGATAEDEDGGFAGAAFGAQYDRGLDWSTILQRLDIATKDEGLSNYIIAGAPLYFCPEHDKT